MPPFNRSKLAGSFSVNAPPPCSPEKAAERARILIGCYRRDDAANPEIYAAALITVLASYPETVVERVTHPLGGLPGRLKWPPAIAEVRDACEAEMKPYHDQMRRQRLEAERMAALPAPLEDRKASLARVKARAPEIWPNDGAKQQVRAQENLAKLCREAGVDPASLADRPGAPVRGWKRLDVSEMMPGTAE